MILRHGPWARALKRLSSNRPAILSAVILVLLTIAALLGPRLLPYPPDQQDMDRLTQSPSLVHPFGTDSLGRDLLSRVLEGARVSLLVALFTAVSALVVGGLYGAVAGLAGGRWDTWLMRALDLFYSLPSLLLLIFINAALGQGLTGILVALSLEGMLTVARLVRAQVLSLKTAEFVIAALALGQTRKGVLFKHLLPNLLGPLLVTLTFLIPSNIMYEAFLSFIGLGIPAPYSSWGTLTNEGWRGLHAYPHLLLFPGLAIFLSMVSFQTLGEGLRQALDPRRRA